MLGGLPVIQPYTTFGLHFIFYYFFCLFVIFPFLNVLDKFLYDVYVYSTLKKSKIFSFDFDMTKLLNVYKNTFFLC